jgi:hypothetical protein
MTEQADYDSPWKDEITAATARRAIAVTADLTRSSEIARLKEPVWRSNGQVEASLSMLFALALSPPR